MVPITYPKHYRNLPIADLKKECFKVFTERFAGKKVVNKATGAQINLKSRGAKHALYARTGGFEKVVCILKIDKILAEAKLAGTEKGKTEGVICALKFKTAVLIDDRKFTVIAVVKVTKEGRMYYDHILLQ
jgi:hypothetical protein